MCSFEPLCIPIFTFIPNDIYEPLICELYPSFGAVSIAMLNLRKRNE